MTLFLRDKRRVELTPAGRVFADETRGLLAGLEASARQASRVERGEVGTLTIGFEGLSQFAFIPRAVQTFQVRYPDVSIQLLEMSATEQSAALKDHRIELGFVVREGGKIGLSCSANAVLTDIVKRVERNELSPDPRHITELRLN